MSGGEGAASVPLTLGYLAVEALLRESPPDNNAPSNTKIARWKLAQEIQKNLEGKPSHSMNISIEDLNLIKSRIGSGFAAALVGPADVAIELGEEESQKVAQIKP